MGNKKWALLSIVTIASLILLFAIITLSNTNIKVAFDETRSDENKILDTEPLGGSTFADTLQKNGFDVTALFPEDRGKITYEKLKKYDVLIITSLRSGYSHNEIKAIEKFVSKGGGLLLCGKNWIHNDERYNDIARRFGVSFATNGNLCDPIDCGRSIVSELYYYKEIRDPLIWVGYHRICLQKGTYIIPGRSEAIAYSNYSSFFDKFEIGNPEYLWGNKTLDPGEIQGRLPVLTTLKWNRGYIVFISCSGQFTNDYLEHYDNKEVGVILVEAIAYNAEGIPWWERINWLFHSFIAFFAIIVIVIIIRYIRIRRYQLQKEREEAEEETEAQEGTESEE